MTQSWTVLVPVKGTADSKSRLGPSRRADERAALAAAFATDAVSALLAAPSVAEVIVVAPEGDLAAALERVGARMVPDPGEGLNAAIRAGLAWAREPTPGEGSAPRQAARATDSSHHGRLADGGRPAPPLLAVAAMLGDLPALTPDAIEEALGAAAAHPLAYVADAEGTGTTLITATPGHDLVPRFGAGSAARHAAAGHADLGAAAGARVRRDVDTEDDLAAALDLGVGPATAAALTGTAAILRTPARSQDAQS